MELCKFSEGLLNQGGDATMELWKGEMPVPDGMESALYHFLVRYYYIPESPYNFAVLDGRRLRGFLLAAPAAMPECHDSAREWILPHLTNDARKAFFKEYWDYVNSNSDAERRAALPGEVLLLLFGSLQRGCGRIMMEAFESECRKNGVASYLLWTDETCDFEYYRKNRFTAVAHFPCAAAIKGKHLETWLFRKTL